MKNTFSIFFTLLILLNGLNTFANDYQDSLVLEIEKTNDLFKKSELLLQISNGCLIEEIDIYAIPLIEICNKLEKGNINKERRDTILSFKAQAYNNLGFMYKKQGLIEKAIKHFNQSLQISENTKDYTAMADVYSNLASTYQQQEEFSAAEELHLKALKLYKKSNDLEGIGIIYNNLGNLYSESNDVEMSLKYYQESFKIWDKLQDPRYIGYALNKIGDNFDHLGNSDSALVNYKNALALFTNEKLSDEIAWTYDLIGKHYLKKNEYKKAEENLLKGYKIVQKMYLIDNEESITKDLYHLYEKQGNYNKALFYYKRHISISDSIKNESTQKAAIQQMAKHEYEKQKAIDDANHEKEIAIEQEAKAKQTILTYATGGGLGLVGIFLLVVFNRLKVTRKQKSIIEEQKTEVEKQKTVVELAHTELEEKNKEITDSIQYAKRIQNAILPPNKVVKEYLTESFILYKPKDIVAGDFYWLEQKNNKILFAAADCTGHGVPGAMVSVVCNNGLNRSVREYGLTDPGEILNKTREIVVQEFEKSEEEVKDGMDIALCSLEGNKLQYAGAHNPLWIIRGGELLETKANKQPIGQFDNPEPYTTHTLELEQGDSLYIFSDGYADQFGGEKGKKLKTANFKKLLLSIQNEDMQHQKQLIDEAFENWKGNLEQLDDVCVIGVKV